MDMDLAADSLSMPTTSLTLLLLLLLSSVIFFLTLGRQQKEKPPIAGSVFHQLFYFSHVHDYHTRLASKHRTFQIFGPSRQIYTVDPGNVEYILRTNFANYGKGNHNQEKMEDLLGDGIFAVDGSKWRHQRKLASLDFSTRMLREVSGNVFKSNAAKLAQMIAFMKPSQPYDLQDLLLKSTMDSIFKVGFGVELDSLSGANERGAAFARAFDDSSATVSLRYVDIMWKLKRFLNVGAERAHKRNLTFINDFIRDLICGKIDAMNQSQNDDRSDMLSRFLEESRRDPENMTQKYLRDIILNFLIAGKDTTAGTLAWFFYVLCTHQSIQKKVVEDVDRAVEETATVTGDVAEFARGVTDVSLEKMHYLHATLTETLRLYPAVPMDAKQCFEDNTLPDGHKVGKGDVVAYLQYAMGRMRFLWGEDAEIFRPERWLDEEGRFQPQSPFKFTAFQAGPRICLGKEFAYRQMKIFAAVLLHFFSFRLENEDKIVNYRIMLTLHVDGGLQVCSSPRRDVAKQ